ncbi:MAG: RNA polymerase sigma factor region1.1 domain-containing protein, partial [Actinomycetota bacterium]|nr:RNA polymerase sigma factor region1.1 domain-containing protein [Actinomycetota bacterium]
MSSSSRPLPPEFAVPQLRALFTRGKTQGFVTSDDVRGAFEEADIPLARMKPVLRTLAEEGVPVVVAPEEPVGGWRDRAVAAAGAARRTTTT